MDEIKQIRPEDKLMVRWLEPGAMSIAYDAQSAKLTVRLDSGEEYVDARVTQAFPVTLAGQYVDFSNSKGEAIGMLRSLDGLAEVSRKAVDEALKTRCLIPTVGRILDLREIRPSVIYWQVTTNRGERTFHSESPRESVRYLTSDRIRVTDLAGNQYDVPSLSALDTHSRALLETLI